MCNIDLNIPKTIRKGVKTYTKYPFSNFMSFHRLSSNYKAFTTNLSSDFVLKNVSYAPKDPRWKEAIMRAFHKNYTWENVDLFRGKKQ